MADLVLLGAPGAGKGTQAELLQEWLPLPRISTGELFRLALDSGTEIGRVAEAYVESGELVPDETVVAMVRERITQPDCADGVIFDGFPRTAGQAEALEAMLAQMARRVDLVIYLSVSPDALLERLSGRWTCRRCGRVYHRVHSPESKRGTCDVCGGELYQRDDDAPETQRRRISVYLEQTAPLRAYYRNRGLLVELDGNREESAVQTDIKRVVLSALSNVQSDKSLFSDRDAT